jgi:hypothetical protein
MKKPIEIPKLYYCPYSETKSVKCDMASPCLNCLVFLPRNMSDVLISEVQKEDKFFSSFSHECNFCNNMTYNLIACCEKCNAEDEYELQ